MPTGMARPCANLHSVQRILRHSDPRTTAGTYLHLEPGYLRREIDLLKFEAPEKPAPAQPEAASAPESAPLAAILLLGPGEGGAGVPTHHPLHPENSAAYAGAGYRGRTGDIQLGKTKKAVSGRYGQCQVVENTDRGVTWTSSPLRRVV